MRYREVMHSVRLSIEGELPGETVASPGEDLEAKLERIEKVPHRGRALRE